MSDIKQSRVETFQRCFTQNPGKYCTLIDTARRWKKTSNGWKVYDITAAGIRLIINYRSSFNSQIRRGGIEGLLRKLVEKNRTLDAKDKEESAALVKTTHDNVRKFYVMATKRVQGPITIGSVTAGLYLAAD